MDGVKEDTELKMLAKRLVELKREYDYHEKYLRDTEMHDLYNYRAKARSDPPSTLKSILSVIDEISLRE